MIQCVSTRDTLQQHHGTQQEFQKFRTRKKKKKKGGVGLTHRNTLLADGYFPLFLGIVNGKRVPRSKMTEETTFSISVFVSSPVVFTIALVGLYSFLINSIHGHPTFWKWKRWVVPLSSSTKRARLKSIVRKPSKDRVMETIEEYILHEALSFLTADEMLIISSLSRRFRAMTQQKKVWYDLGKIYFTPSLPDENTLSALVNKRAFFTYLKQYPLLLAGKSVNRFVIEGKVYELPAQFISGNRFISRH